MTVTLSGPAPETFAAGGCTFRILDNDTPTSGRLGVVECALAPGWGGPPQHVHRAHDETFYVLTGTVRFSSGTQHLIATPGSSSPHRSVTRTPSPTPTPMPPQACSARSPQSATSATSGNWPPSLPAATDARTPPTSSNSCPATPPNQLVPERRSPLCPSWSQPPCH